MNEETETISFSAILHQARTDASGGWRITFDVPETNSEEILELSKLRNTTLQIVVVRIKDEF